MADTAIKDGVSAVPAVGADLIPASRAGAKSILTIDSVRNYGWKRTGTAVDYQTDDETIVGCTGAIPALRTITLATAFTFNQKFYIVKDESGTAGPSNIIRVVTQGAQTIDGVASLDIIAPYGDLKFYSDGTNWLTVT